MEGQLQITAIPALEDNYIWAACKGNNAIIVDPGEARPVLEFLGNDLKLRAIFITHSHVDHVEGVQELSDAHPKAMVYHPDATANENTDIRLQDGDEARPHFFDMTFSVIATPGHTRDHISYVGNDVLFCGDALFSCGCGRLFEGNQNDLADTMSKFEKLGHSLKVCCGHEYTLSNIAFARAVEPNNEDLKSWEREAKALRGENKPTLPVTLGDEFKRNPFLRASEKSVNESASKHAGKELKSKSEVLGELRAWKDGF